MATRLAGTAAAQWALTAAQTAWNAVTAAGAVVMNLLNTAFKANPILFIIGLVFALVVAFKTLWDNSAAFRDFFIGMWHGIQNVVGGVIDFIKSIWNGLPGFFQGIANTIGGIFSGIGNAIKNAFKTAVNIVVDLLNGAISAINLLIKGINLVPGINIPMIPKIPRMHTGGVVPGMLGSETMAVLQAGERIVPRGQGGNDGVTVTFAGDTDSALATAIQKLVRTRAIRFS
jgi:phage-related protein